MMCQKEEQQKTKKKKKSTKKKALVIEEPPKISQDSSSPEHNLDSQDGSLTDHEFNTGTVKSPGGPQPMAPGVFLSQRRPSMSSPNSTNSTSTNSSGMAKGDRVGSADAKGEHVYRVWSVQKKIHNGWSRHPQSNCHWLLVLQKQTELCASQWWLLNIFPFKPLQCMLWAI